VEAAWIGFVSEHLVQVRARLADLGFTAVEVDPRGYRRGGLLTERPAQR